MKVLAVLVNYGIEQIEYLKQVITNLKSFQKYSVTVIVNSNIPLKLHGVDEVNVFKLKDYQLLPLTCRKTIWEHKDAYDVFIYGENDHLFMEHHLDAFLDYSKILPNNRIAGLIQYELDTNNNLFYTAYHKDYDWDMNSVEEYGGKKFAHFTNLHQASFILTKEQLLRIGKLHDFTKFMGTSHYSKKCKVNTDIYQFCGMKKVICISDFYLNLIHHLPDIYIKGDNGRKQIGSWDSRMQSKLEKLMA